MLPSTPLESSADVYDWISRFINLEQVRSKNGYCLDRMELLAALAGHPERCAPSIHVAGSKGKGSVTGMIASVLEASGIKTARYASPHVSDFRERLSMGKNFFDEKIYVSAGKELAKIVEGLPESLAMKGSGEPTFFELLTLWFFLCARLVRCEAMAVETGLGGRLDATNLLDPLLSVITVIELEHTDYLGNSIASIAGEKAGIVKAGKPLVLAEQSAEALEVFREHAARKKSPLLYFPDCVELHNVRVSHEGTSFTLVLKKSNTPMDLSVPTMALTVQMPGEVQAKNAGLAVLAFKTAFPNISEEQIREGLANFCLPARFERISNEPLLIIDGAHTKRSVEIALKTFTGLYGSGGILIFGCAAGKDVFSMAELCLGSCFSRIIITRPGTFKESKPDEVYEAFVSEARKTRNPPELLFLPQTAEAIERAIDLALKHGLPILGTGSFYLAGEIKKDRQPKTNLRF